MNVGKVLCNCLYILLYRARIVAKDVSKALKREPNEVVVQVHTTM